MQLNTTPGAVSTGKTSNSQSTAFNFIESSNNSQSKANGASRDISFAYQPQSGTPSAFAFVTTTSVRSNG